MWKFSRAKGQRTALIHSFRLCGEEDSASSDPHIYPSVEYWTTSVFAQVLPQPSIEQTKSTPHFLCIITTRIQELGWRIELTMRFQDIAGAIEANKSLVGKKFKGATIDELICIPVGYELEYKKLYVTIQNAEQTLAKLVELLNISPFDLEYHIYAVFDKYRLTPNGAFVYTDINEIVP